MFGAIGASLFSVALATNAQAQCGNAIACENSASGNLPTEWDVSGIGDPTLQGFATDVSVNRGQTITFKISTTASTYRIDIYRLGYYGGRGARKITTFAPSAVQNQPACLRDATTGLVDCGNWASSASWAVPSTAVSGVYLARLVRPDTNGASHIIFIVRNDTANSSILVQTSDPTWQAYNKFGGASLYGGDGPGLAGRAYKVSYNRPLANRSVINGDSTPLGFFFSAEYPMVRWLEANGYDVSYAAGVDTDRRGSAPLKTHKVFLSVGHDEYWSAGQRANVEAARGAGVHLGFFSGNEIFWKTRWENSIAGPSTSYRTLVCYKETHANAKIDPSTTWTGTWRDARFSPPADGGRPENALSGQIFTVNGDRADPMFVPSSAGKLRFWRNTDLATIADGSSAQFPAGMLGYEWDETLDNGFAPPGLVRLSETTLRVDGYYLQDNGSTYGPGTGTHSLSLYRHSSGALVFGAGTTQWGWGLDATHDYPGMPVDSRIQQATVNLLADMGVQPTTLRPGLIAASASTDITPPVSVVVSAPATAPAWMPLTVFGLATDVGGRPAGVEFSTDGGNSWHPAVGTDNWSASWIPGGPGIISFKTRAVDDSGRIETPGPGISITLSANSTRNSIWSNDTLPSVLSNPDSNSVELGVRFKADRDGWITALRFYKSQENTGPHLGNLWTDNGNLLATVTFAGESESGWQEMLLPAPVPITAGRFYVASYHTNSGHYAHDVSYFAGTGVDSGPLSAPADGVAGGNGLYVYGPTAFPTQTSVASNYWVDVVFAPSLSGDAIPPLVLGVSPKMGFSNAGTLTSVTATFNEPMRAGSITATSFYLKDSQNNLLPISVTYDSATQTATLQPASSLKGKATYTATIKGGSTGVSDQAGNRLSTDFSWTFSTASPPSDGFNLWPPGTVPTWIDNPDSSPVELGVRFVPDRDGQITAIRFYKSNANTGLHTGSLWNEAGTRLGTVSFGSETTSGWQQARFASPIPVAGGVPYVASYHTDRGHYSDDVNYFQAEYRAPPLSAPADTVTKGNGLYAYGAGSFPNLSSQASNYWVDVAFLPASLTATPTFSPGDGTYSAPVSVVLSDATPGAQIFFTTDGTPPSLSSTRYTGPITVNKPTTLRAIAAVNGQSASAIALANYDFKSGPPVIAPAAGTYSANQSATITAPAGAAVFYTLDGSNPSSSSTPYSVPIAITGSVTLKAIAIVPGWSGSDVATAAYVLQAPPPTFSPAGGNFSAAQAVTLTDANLSAVIYYTADGTTPTTASTRYIAPFTCSVTTTIKAMAAVSGWSNSAVVSATYTFTPARPLAPASLSATAVSAGQINLAWRDLATNETGFKIERKTGSTGTYAQIATAAADLIAYSDTTVSPSTTYFYRIRATNGGGDSSYSNEVSATTPAPGAPPPPWVSGDIGSVGIAGSATYVNGSFTVKGAGADIWDASDAFRFVYQPLNGNGEIVARVVSIQNTNAWAKAGVMIRESTAANAKNAFMAVTPGNGLTFQRRLASGGSSTYTGGGAATAPYWVRLVRTANTITGYASNNGSSWTQVGTDTVSMNATVQIGIAVTAHTTSATCSAVIDNVSVIVPLAAPSSLTANAVSSSQINLSWVDNATNETGYKIERKIGAGGAYAQIASVGAGATSYSDSSLASATTYFYRVRATNGTSDSPYSSEASATTTMPPPAMPGGLVATTVSNSQINLSWTDVATETGFKIERKTSATGTYAQIAIVQAGVVNYSDAGLSVNTTYVYRVRATNAGGDSPYSAEASATTLNAAPAAPTGLVATAVSTTQVNLSWVRNSTNESGFRIERSAGSNYVEITTVGAGVTSFSDTGLAPATTYLYRVRATNSLGDSAYSNIATATTSTLPPAAPTGLVATASSSSQINLTWADVAGETGFKLERKTGLAGSYAQIATIAAGTTIYSNTGLTANTTYYYRIRATNSGGDSPYSLETNATTFNAPPAAPTGLAATAASSSQINISWADVANETGFKIERKTGSGGTYAEIATVGAGVVTYNNTGLAAATTYFYRVRASNTAGDSGYSNETSATTLSLGPPAPTGLTATAVSSSQINLSWPDVTNETGYKIERKTGSGGTYAQIATTGANVTTYNNSGLTSSTTYFYRVRATSAAGDSGYSPEASAITLSNPPAFRSASSGAAASGTLTIGKPAGTSQGDVMVAAVAVRPSSATISASGWTLVRRVDNASGNSNSLAIYYKVAGASEPTTYSFTFNTSAGAAGGIRAFTGVDLTTPIDIDGGQATPSGLNHTAPSVTTRFANDLVVTSHCIASSASFTPPSGMTEAFDKASGTTGSGGISIEGNYQAQVAVGATGARTATAANDADTGNAHTLALKGR